MPRSVRGTGAEHNLRSCPRCGEAVTTGAIRCELCGTSVEGGNLAADKAAATAFLDTIHLRPEPGEPDDERIVRPSLAILYRMAVGPAADHYAPRFLEYERKGHSFPSWNWAAPWAPTVWAFYHKLWTAGLAFALWPIFAMTVFGFIDPYLGDSTAASLACAFFLLWVGPGIVAALIADTLLYRHSRHLVRDAEAKTVRPEEAARLLGERSPIALGSAVLLGGVAIVASLFVAVPGVETAVSDRVVRNRVAEALAALEPLQRQVEEGWGYATSTLIAPGYDTVGRQLSSSVLLGAVNVSLVSGRLRLALGPLIPELSGRSILLAPALDRDEHVRWICVPVDIPARYLPHACRQG
jgi:hypothetical protein